MNIFEMAFFIGFALCCGIFSLLGMRGSTRLAITIGFGSAFISLLTVVLFSFLYRLFSRRHLQKVHVPLWAVLAVLMSASFALYFRAHHSVNQTEDRRRWLREIDTENAKAGFIRDTNGALIYIGATNSQSKSNQEPMK
jgi:hypothetical protein